MDKEPQPSDNSDLLYMSPEERQVCDSVLKIAVLPESRQNIDNVIMSGGLRQRQGARFIYGRITSQGGYDFDYGYEPYADHVLELYACDSLDNKFDPDEPRLPNERNQTARGSVQVIKILPDGVIGRIDDQEFRFDDSVEGKVAAAEFIRAFYADNYIDQIARLDVTFGNI